ncbi:hypothetical protein FGB62_236g017 [Gracilaria domingensis]|nr:hypothetical protein FGB62_236g017 [Gracilaria domingensis]
MVSGPSRRNIRPGMGGSHSGTGHTTSSSQIQRDQGSLGNKRVDGGSPAQIIRDFACRALGPTQTGDTVYRLVLRDDTARVFASRHNNSPGAGFEINNPVECRSASNECVPYNEQKIPTETRGAKKPLWAATETEAKPTGYLTEERMRTFPIQIPCEDQNSMLGEAISSLNRLFCDPRTGKNSNVSNKSAVSRRAYESLRRRVQTWKLLSTSGTKPQLNPIAYNTDSIAELGATSYNSWNQFFEERYSRTSNECTHTLTRGTATSIIASRIELLASQRSTVAVKWEQYIPNGHEAVFTPLHNSLQNLRRSGCGTSNSKPPVRSRVFGKHKEFVAVIEKAQKAEMLQWSVVKQEEPWYSERADLIIMKSFAVVKSAHRDRLISWPKWQNEILPELPYTFLPKPDDFRALSFSNGTLSAFYFTSKTCSTIYAYRWTWLEYFPCQRSPLATYVRAPEPQSRAQPPTQATYATKCGHFNAQCQWGRNGECMWLTA